jgi:heme-degrading monooxygenase HmoA
MTARVMVLATVREGEEGAFEAAYALVTSRVRGTAGHLRDELLRRRDRPGHYVLLSEWESLDAFLEWEDAPVHREVTTPMRPYWAGRVERVLYEVPETSDTAAPAAVLDRGAS